MTRVAPTVRYLASALLLVAALGSAEHAGEAPKLDAPVDYVLGEDCFL